MTTEERDELRRIYDEADDATSTWARTMGLACPQGCGICSSTHDPACLPVEAEFVAEYLFESRRDLLDLVVAADPAARENGPCIFYRDDTPLHCTIYTVRPLLCRLFGFSGSRNAEGNLRFVLCKHMPAPAAWGSERRRMYGSTTDTDESAAPPVVDAFRRPLGAIRPGDEGHEARLSLQIPSALSRVGLARQLRASRSSTDRGPDDETPTPRPFRPAA